jgi:hypothetical protein
MEFRVQHQYRSSRTLIQAQPPSPVLNEPQAGTSATSAPTAPVRGKPSPPFMCKSPIGRQQSPQLYKFNGNLCVLYNQVRNCNFADVLLYLIDTLLTLHKFNQTKGVSYVLARTNNNPVRIIPL